MIAMIYSKTFYGNSLYKCSRKRLSDLLSLCDLTWQRNAAHIVRCAQTKAPTGGILVDLELHIFLFSFTQNPERKCEQLGNTRARRGPFVWVWQLHQNDVHVSI